MGGQSENLSLRKMLAFKGSLSLGSRGVFSFFQQRKANVLAVNKQKARTHLGTSTIDKLRGTPPAGLDWTARETTRMPCMCLLYCCDEQLGPGRLLTHPPLTIISSQKHAPKKSSRKKQTRVETERSSAKYIYMANIYIYFLYFWASPLFLFTIEHAEDGLVPHHQQGRSLSQHLEDYGL